MAQQQQNITIAAPGFYGLNTEDSPLQQDTGYALVADNAVVDRFGRIGSRKAWAEFTTSINITYTPAVGVVRTEQIVDRIGSGVVNGVQTVLCTLSVFQYDAADSLIREDYFLCKLEEPSGGVFEISELPLPAVAVDSFLTDAQIIMFNDVAYVFSKGNDVLKYDGTTVTNLFSGTVNVDYIPPQDDTGIFATTMNGDVACAAYGRMWVTGVNGDYQNIYYSDLLAPTKWYDGKAAPTDSLNTAGIIDVALYWPNGTDRIVGITAHNGFLFVFGRQSILVYGGISEDPAGTSGAFLQDAIPNIGLVSRDAITNTGADILFVDDSGVRSAGRTIQEKSVPLGDLTGNIRGDITDVIAQTADKTTISLDYWADESLIVVQFSDQGLSYALESRQPSPSGALKVTRWTDCRFNRSMYYETSGTARVLLCGNQDNAGLLIYDGSLQYDNMPYEFKYESNALTFGQPANTKFLKQIDYTVVSTQVNAQGFAGWGYSGALDYSKRLSIAASTPALFGLAQYNIDEFGPGLATIRRYRVNTKGSGETVVIGLRVDINGNSCSLQEINVQTLLGRLN